MRPFDLRPSDPFEGSYDIDEVVAQIPADQRVKGMFFGRHVTRLGDAWPSIAARLEAPPRLGRYLPFGDYPIRDYSRVAHEVAIRAHRGVGTHEALRRTARDDLGEFTASTLGRVMMALVVDARSLLLRYPDAYERCTVGQTVTVEPGPGGLRLRYTGMYGACSYTVGQVEGMVLAYQPTCRILGTLDARAATLELDVRL